MFIGDGEQGTTEVTSIDVASSGDIMVLGVKSQESNLSGSNQLAMSYDLTDQSESWTKIFPNSINEINVYFAHSDSKILIVWTYVTSQDDEDGFKTFLFLETSTGN